MRSAIKFLAFISLSFHSLNTLAGKDAALFDLFLDAAEAATKHSKKSKISRKGIEGDWIVVNDNIQNQLDAKKSLKQKDLCSGQDMYFRYKDGLSLARRPNQVMQIEERVGAVYSINDDGTITETMSQWHDGGYVRKTYVSKLEITKAPIKIRSKSGRRADNRIATFTLSDGQSYKLLSCTGDKDTASHFDVMFGKKIFRYVHFEHGLSKDAATEIANANCASSYYHAIDKRKAELNALGCYGIEEKAVKLSIDLTQGYYTEPAVTDVKLEDSTITLARIEQYKSIEKSRNKEAEAAQRLAAQLEAERLKRIASAGGYKDLRFGMNAQEVSDLGVCSAVYRATNNYYQGKSCYTVAGRKRDLHLYFYNGELGQIDVSFGIYSEETFNKVNNALTQKYSTYHQPSQGDWENFWLLQTHELQYIFDSGKVATVLNRQDYDKNVELLVQYSNDRAAKGLAKRFAKEEFSSMDL